MVKKHIFLRFFYFQINFFCWLSLSFLGYEKKKEIMKPTNFVKRKANQPRKKKRVKKQQQQNGRKTEFITISFAVFSWVGLALDSDVRRFQY